MPHKIIILGGGVAGMSAAHELAERGFEVEVFERNTVAGGKARSVEVPGTAQDGRPGYPGEHGFRFFPRFYKHVTDTMKRIPFGDGGASVHDNLVGTSRIEMARFDASPFTVSARFPQNLDDFLLMIHDAFGDSLGVDKADREFFGERVWQILTSCQQRREDEYEKLDWWKFIDADNPKRNEAYRHVFGYGLTRSLVASKANLASTKTVGDILVQLLFALEPGIAGDRLLNGPTNDVWIAPWLKHLESLRDSLVHMIIHDLRTPLTGVIGSMQILEMGTAGELNELQQEVVEMSLSSAQTLLDMINDLLNISKMESGTLTVQTAEIHSHEVAKKALHQVRALASGKEVELHDEFASDLPMLLADAELLCRILVNLMGNAIKFTPCKGRVKLNITLDVSGNEVIFAIQDSGIGIPPEAFERIFDKFGQIEATSGARTSTGLGLTFCKMAVEAHGGRIWVESTLDAGSTFSGYPNR